jgi:type IV secretory pathway VirB3-like protein
MALMVHTLFKGLTRPATVPFPGRVTVGSFLIILVLGIVLALVYPWLALISIPLYVGVSFLEEDDPYRLRYVTFGLLMWFMSLRTWRLWRANSCSPFANDEADDHL